MWIFTTFGFFSVVRKTDGDQLTIRSRTRGDLLRLRQHYLPSASAPVSHQGTDYPWRMMCRDREFAEALSRIAVDIDYANFKDEVAKVTGTSRAKRYGQVWQALYGMTEDHPEPEHTGWEGLPWLQKDDSGKAAAFGGVVFDASGNVLLREVAGHYDGYHWTFAKGRPDQGESPRQAAVREAREEMGVEPTILLPLRDTFAGGTTRNHYFVMTVDRNAVNMDFHCDETSSIRWASPEDARSLIGQTTNAVGRKRDLAVLEAALNAVYHAR